MPSLVVPNSVQVKLSWTMIGASMLNVFGATAASGPTVNQALADALDTAIKAALTASGMTALLHTGTALASIKVRNVALANQAEFVGSGAPLVGTGAGDALPRSNAVIVTLRTSGAGRSFRGRLYFSGWNEAQNDASGLIVAAASNAAVDFVNRIRTALTGQGLTMAVLSPELPVRTTKHGIVLPLKPAFATNVVSQQSRSAGWGSQRGRTHRP